MSDEFELEAARLVNTLCHCPNEHGSRVERDCDVCLAAALRQTAERVRKEEQERCIDWVKARARDCGCSEWIERSIKNDPDVAIRSSGRESKE